MSARRFTLLSFVFGTALLASGQTAGRLCIAESECRDYSCGEAVEAKPHARPFTLSSPDGNAVYFGTVKPGETKIACSGYTTVELRISGRNIRRRSTVRVAFAQDAGGAWETQRNEERLPSRVLVHVRPGRYQISIEAEHFIQFSKRIDVAEGGAKVTADLQALPRLIGTVIDRKTRGAIAGALISTDVNTEAISDAEGRFALEAEPEQWPKTITVSAGGYAGTEILVPAARVSASFDQIALSRGGTIAVELEQTEPGQVVALDLQRTSNNGRTPGATIRTLAVPESERQGLVKIDGVEPGEYIVLARGAKEWERFGEPVTLSDQNEVRLSLRIAPFRLRIRTITDGEPLRNARVSLMHRETHWKVKLTTDEAGEANLILWQEGRFNAMVSAAGLTSFMERKTITDGEDTEWIFEVPRRSIRGTVVDARTGAPIAGAAVILNMLSVDRYRLVVKTKTGTGGTFEFSPVAHGQHTLKAAAAKYPPSELKYTFLEPEQSRDVTLQLYPGSTVQLTVSDPRGTPLAGAMVLDFLGLTRGGRGFTDPNGVARIMMGEGEIRDVYVIPRDGSLGFVRVKSGTEQASVRIADGVSRIVLRTESEARVAIPNISVVIRHEGRVLPIEVIEALRTVQGARVKSDSEGRIVLNHMPAGLYEFWPVGSAAELRAVAAGAGPHAAVKLAAAPGENLAVMTFAAVEKP